jgi:putative spermidine/putrescine transport system ATP-binding protein
MSAIEAGRANPGATVELRDLRRAFGQTRALDGLSLTLQPGELLALLGPSGCGKTTVLRALAGFESIDSGRILVDGKDVNGIPAQRRDMGMVFQSYSLFPNMNAVDNVGFGLRMRKVGRVERRQRAAAVLEMVGLGDRLEQYPHQMSGGQQQRVALARALAFEPRVLLLDEPLSALDAKVRLELRGQIRALQQRLGITTLFVTHDQEEALSLADRVCVMRSGGIEQVATPSEMYRRPATPFVAEFVGTMNRIPAHVEGDSVVVLGRRAGIRNLDGRTSGTRVDVMVRPEELQIAVTPNGAGVVTAKTFLGSITRVAVILDGDTAVSIDWPSEVASHIELGAAVEVALIGDEVMIGEAMSSAGASAPLAGSATASGPAAGDD